MDANKNYPVIISIESSGSTCGAALSQGSESTVDYSVFGRNLHDRLLAEFVRRILEDAELSMEEVDAVAVSSGPGSFTGLRIGAGIAKGLCFEDKPKLIAVPSLSAIAYSAVFIAKNVNAKEIISIVPAHKDLIYYQRFDVGGNELSEIIHTGIDEFRKMDFRNTFLCGPGAKFIDKGVSMPEFGILSPRFIAKLAFKMFEEGKFTPAEDFTPMYVQEFHPKTEKKSLNI